MSFSIDFNEFFKKPLSQYPDLVIVNNSPGLETESYSTEVDGINVMDLTSKPVLTGNLFMFGSEKFNSFCLNILENYESIDKDKTFFDSEVSDIDGFVLPNYLNCFLRDLPMSYRFGNAGVDIDNLAGKMVQNLELKTLVDLNLRLVHFPEKKLIQKILNEDVEMKFFEEKNRVGYKF